MQITCYNLTFEYCSIYTDRLINVYTIHLSFQLPRYPFRDMFAIQVAMKNVLSQ